MLVFSGGQVGPVFKGTLEATGHGELVGWGDKTFASGAKITTSATQAVGLSDLEIDANAQEIIHSDGIAPPSASGGDAGLASG